MSKHKEMRDQIIKDICKTKEKVLQAKIDGNYFRELILLFLRKIWQSNIK